MKTALKKLRNSKKGFTLVELIVCLVIIAILAAIAIPTMLGYVNKAKETADSYECRTVLMAAQTICSQDAANGTITAAGDVTATVKTDVAALAEVAVANITNITVSNDTNSGLPGKVTGIAFKASSGYTWTYASGAWTRGAKG